MKKAISAIYKRRNYKPIVLVFYLLSFVCSCNSNNLKTYSTNEAANLQNKSADNQLKSQNQNDSKSINFKGVSLQTDIPNVSSIEATEEPAVILETDYDKPDSNPRYISLKLAGEYSKSNESNFPPEIKIYPINEFRQAITISKSYTEVFDNNIKSLQNMILQKRAKKQEIVNIPYYEGSPEVLTHFKKVNFKNGDGILYVTQYNVDYATIINNQSLVCVFQGLTSDEKYYIMATFPVTVKGFPDDYYATKAGNYKLPNTYFDEKTNPAEYAKYKKYLSSVESFLDKTKPEEFNPDLNKIEQTISSLEVNWKD